MEARILEMLAGYIARALNACLWGYLIYHRLLIDNTWVDNINHFLVLYATFLLLGLIGQLILGYIFYQKKPSSYITPVFRKIPHAILFGVLIFLSGYLLPHLY